MEHKFKKKKTKQIFIKIKKKTEISVKCTNYFLVTKTKKNNTKSIVFEFFLRKINKK